MIIILKKLENKKSFYYNNELELSCVHVLLYSFSEFILLSIEWICPHDSRLHMYVVTSYWFRLPCCPIFFLWGKFRLSHPLPSLVMGVFLGHQTDQTAPLPPASPHSLPPSPTSPPVFVHLSHHPSCLPLLFLFPPLCFLYFALISILFPYSLNLNCYSLCLAQPKVMLYSSM